MRVLHPTRRERLASVLLSGAITALFGYALLLGLAATRSVAIDDPLKLFTTVPPPPPLPDKRVEPRPRRSHRPEGAAAPPNLKSKATELIAPPPIVPPPVPPPVIVAPIAGTGADASSGASDRPGPGTGAGGIGTGTGSGGQGDGDGDGGEETPPRRLKGRLKDSDYPRAADEAGAGGTVSVRYAVETNGRVTGCIVTRSSGNAALDDTTCRLITERYRYAPSRDAAGRPVKSWIVVDHEWIMTHEPADPPARN